MQFEPLESWIWLPSDKYPERQRTFTSMMIDDNRKEGFLYTVAEFAKCYNLAKPIKSVSIRTSADTFMRLYVNSDYVLSGPTPAGSDFLENERRRPQHYAMTQEISGDFIGLSGGKLDLRAVVRMRPAHYFECSQTHGGFFLTAHVRFEDGTRTVIRTDSDWECALLPAYTGKGMYDGRLLPHEKVRAERIDNVWHCLTSPIPSCSEELICPDDNCFILSPGETLERELTMDMIYTGYPDITVQCDGTVKVDLRLIETDEEGVVGHYIFSRDDCYRGSMLMSGRRITVSIKNESDKCAEIKVCFAASHYPTPCRAVTSTSDEELNLVTEVCAHTLKYCRQTIHLDSGRHCEPLACTGDYYIESLMTAFTFGDMGLAAFDVRRTAELIRYNDGRMFHTTYSLIWVQMLWDVYMLTGETELLSDCEEALIILLERFKGYMGDNGLIETPPDYMFIDWLFPDEISLHHPPKALGQTCLNLYYYGALKTASRIWEVLGETPMAEAESQLSEELHSAIEENLFDSQRGLFFEGLSTPESPERLGMWLPQKVDKRYYRCHANILAAYFGFFDTQKCQGLLDKVMSDNTLGEVQPYFAHFLLEAVYRNGLRDKYTLQILDMWKAPVIECPYGLAEGFHKPEPTYSFDHSHAWGGTPAYSLPLALSGLEIIEAGYKKIRLSPSLLGLESASVEIPTPYGMIRIVQQRGQSPLISLPSGIIIDEG